MTSLENTSTKSGCSERHEQAVVYSQRTRDRERLMYLGRKCIEVRGEGDGNVTRYKADSSC